MLLWSANWIKVCCKEREHKKEAFENAFNVVIQTRQWEEDDGEEARRVIMTSVRNQDLEVLNTACFNHKAMVTLVVHMLPII